MLMEIITSQIVRKTITCEKNIRKCQYFSGDATVFKKMQHSWVRRLAKRKETIFLDLYFD